MNRIRSTALLGLLLLVFAQSAWAQNAAPPQPPTTLVLGAEVPGAVPHRYVVPDSKGTALECHALSPVASSSLRLSVWDDKDAEIMSTDLGGPFQLLFVRANAKQLRVANESPGAYPAYSVKCSALKEEQIRDIVSSGQAVRARISNDDYIAVYKFARQDWSQYVEKTALSNPVRKLMNELMGLDQFTTKEPLVLFIGVAGMARILIVDVLDDRHHDSPDRDNLRRTEGVWVAYIEDDFTPYETSIDVQFNRSTRVKFDQFEPSSAQLSAAAALGLISSGNHPTRIGLKRVGLHLPVDLQVAFTRQGGAYGFRQWQKSLRFRSHGYSLSGSIFVSATEVNLNTHALGVQDIEPLGSPDFQLVFQENRRRFVFAAMRIGWAGFRARAADGRRPREKMLYAIPDLVVGIALPPTASAVGYAGISWPVPTLSRLHLTGGWAIPWQGRLQDRPSPYDGLPLFVGSKVPLSWTLADIQGKTKPVSQGTFGLMFDLFTWP